MTPSRLHDLERRVHLDAAPFVHAQLADEYRREGRHDAAIACCQGLLARHPAYFTARVVLGRSLAALGRGEEAATELQRVLAVAPDHVVAMRELAEVLGRLGRVDEAGHWYRQAATLDRNDGQLASALERVSGEPGRDTSALAAPSQSPAVDLDALLDRLGRPQQPVPPLVEALLSHPEQLLRRDSTGRGAESSPLAVESAGGPDDSLARLEQALRQSDPSSTAAVPDMPSTGVPTPRTPSTAETATVRELERWLEVLAHERAGR